MAIATPKRSPEPVLLGLQTGNRNMLELVETLGFVVSESDDIKIRRFVKEF